MGISSSDREVNYPCIWHWWNHYWKNGQSSAKSHKNDWRSFENASADCIVESIFKLIFSQEGIPYDIMWMSLLKTSKRSTIWNKGFPPKVHLFCASSNAKNIIPIWYGKGCETTTQIKVMWVFFPCPPISFWKFLTIIFSLSIYVSLGPRVRNWRSSLCWKGERWLDSTN